MLRAVGLVFALLLHLILQPSRLVLQQGLPASPVLAHLVLLQPRPPDESALTVSRRHRRSTERLAQAACQNIVERLVEHAGYCQYQQRQYWRQRSGIDGRPGLHSVGHADEQGGRFRECYPGPLPVLHRRPIHETVVLFQPDSGPIGVEGVCPRVLDGPRVHLRHG